MRDLLEQRAAEGVVSPLDFAPHLWREFNHRLLYYERLAWAGRRSVAAANAAPAEGAEPRRDEPPPRGTAAQELRELQRFRDDLRRLYDALRADQPLPRDQYAPDIGSRLADAWNRYRVQWAADAADPARQDEDAAVTAAAQQALRKCHGLVYTAVDYVGWHARVSLSSSHQAAWYGALSRGLEQLQTCLDEFAAWRSDAARQSAALESLTLAQEQSGRLDEALRSSMAEALKNRLTSLGQQQIEDLLSTPLLRAADRRRLLDVLLALPVPGPSVLDVPLDVPTAAPQLTVSPDQRLRCAERLELEAKLLRLAGGAADGGGASAPGATPPAAAGEKPPPEPAGTDEAWWSELRRRGLAFRRAYEQLAVLGQPPAAGDFQRRCCWSIRATPAACRRTIPGRCSACRSGSPPGCGWRLPPFRSA